MDTKTETQIEGAKDLALAKYNDLINVINAVAQSDMRTVNTDVIASVVTVRGAEKTIAQFAAAAKTLPAALFDASCFDKVQDYGYALIESHRRYQATQALPLVVTPTVLKAVDRRDFLLTHAAAMAKSGLIEPSRVAEVRLAPGHKGVASDLGRLISIFRESWWRVEGKTPVTLAMLDELGGLQLELMDDLAAQQQAPTAVGPAAIVRQKAYTLFFNAYDQVRRAISFLRWEEGDVDEFAPSLFAGRGGRPGAQPQPAPQPQPQFPPANPPANGNPQPQPQIQKADVAQGLPGAKPFAD
jgi:hypothetical protein